MKDEISKLTDTLDLMRDEFLRIKVCSVGEVTQLCERAIANIEQKVPVIVQRDKSERRNVVIRVALDELLRVAERILSASD